jgi:hypothetical protein
MRDMLIDALLVLIAASAAGSEMAVSSGSDTNAPWFGCPATDVAASAGTAADVVQPGPATTPSAVADLNVMIYAPTGPNMDAGEAENMAVEGTNGWSLVDSLDGLVHRDTLFRKLDMLLRAELRGSPLRFGVDDEINFVEHHDFRPGFSIPLGVSYQTGPHALKLIAQFAPVLNPTPTDSMGWSGGVGVRIFFRK